MGEDKRNLTYVLPQLYDKQDLDDLVNSIPATIYRCLYDKDWTMLYLSNDFQRLTGYAVADLINSRKHSFLSIIHADDQPEVERIISKALDAGEDYEVEYRIIKKNDEEIWVIDKGRGISDNNGKISCLEGVITNITHLKQAEQQLWQQSKLIEAIIDGVHDILSIQDKDNRIIRYNKAGYEMVGMTPEEVKGKKCYELIGRSRKCEICPTEKSIKSGKLEHVEKYVPEIERYLDCRSNPVFNKDGDIVMIVEQLRDITEQRQSEKLQILLMQIAEKYINASIHDLEEIVNESLQEMGKFVEADRAYIFEYDWVNNVTNNTYEWCAPGIIPEIENLQQVSLDILPDWVNSHKKNMPMYIPDVQALPPGSALREILEPQGIQSLLTIPLTSGNGCLGFVGFDSVARKHEYSRKDRDLLTIFAQMLVNINNRRHSQQLIARQIELQEMITDISSDFISVDSTNLHDKAANLLQQTINFFKIDFAYILFYNEEKDKFDVFNFEEKASGLATSNDHKIEDVIEHEYFAEQIKANRIIELDLSQQNQEVENYIYELIAQSGIRSLLAVPVRSRSQAVGAMVYGSSEFIREWLEGRKTAMQVLANIFSDAYRRVKIDRELINSKEQAEAANRTKSEFLTNISHEIRTPMNSILGFSEVMLNTTTDDRQKNYLKTILSSGKTLLSLINDVLDLSKIEAGRMEVSPEPCDLRVILNEMKQIFAPRIQEKDLQFILEIPDDFPQTIIIDEIRLRQILLNLLGNSIKFTSSGYIKVILKVLKNHKGIIDFAIDIADTGMGVKSKDQKSIFESFSQQSGQDTRKYGGTGLGLTISKRLCELMNGEISLQSKPGLGSIFTVTFSDIKYSDEVIESKDSYQWEDDSIIFKGSRILVVDDVAHNRKLVTTYLENMELNLSEAENGDMAVKIAKELHPDLILMDIRMPGMNGYQATHILKNNDSTRDIRIVALTASTMKSELSQIRKQFDGYLRKPVSKSTLLNELLRHLPWEEQQVLPKQDKKIAAAQQETPNTITADIKSEFNRNFREEIAMQSKMMMIGSLEELTEKLTDFAEYMHLAWLSHNVESLKQYIADFDFEKIKKALHTIAKAFEV